MSIPLMAWYPSAAPVPDTVLVLDLAIGAWLGAALLVSLALLAWSTERSRDLSRRLRWTGPRRGPRPVGRRHPVPGRP